MGLEAINFLFRSQEQIKSAVESNKDIAHNEGKNYVYKRDNDYWIDIELQDFYSLSLRITLCNPTGSVLRALYHLFSFLFHLKGSVLTDMSTKKKYTVYNDEMKLAIEESYLNRKKLFQEMYGDYTAAISSEEFYKRQEQIEKS